MSHDPKPLGGKIISKPVIIFGPLIVLCMLLIVKRLVFGLGSVSDLNGGFREKLLYMQKEGETEIFTEKGRRVRGQ